MRHSKQNLRLHNQMDAALAREAKRQNTTTRQTYGPYPTLAALRSAATRAGYTGRRDTRGVAAMIAYLSTHTDPLQLAIAVALQAG